MTWRVDGMCTYNRTITDTCRKNKGTLGAMDEVTAAVRKELGAVYDGWPIGLGVKVHVVVTVERPETPRDTQESGTVLTDRCWKCGHIFGLPANYCPQCSADQANPGPGTWTCTCERCLREKPLTDGGNHGIRPA
jgi:hypothetical protein